jgi:hypothetical protein
VERESIMTRYFIRFDTVCFGIHIGHGFDLTYATTFIALTVQIHLTGKTMYYTYITHMLMSMSSCIPDYAAGDGSANARGDACVAFCVYDE